MGTIPSFIFFTKITPLTCAGADCPAAWSSSRRLRSWRKARGSCVCVHGSSGCMTWWIGAGSTCTQTRISGGACAWSPVCDLRRFASQRTFCLFYDACATGGACLRNDKLSDCVCAHLCRSGEGLEPVLRCTDKCLLVCVEIRIRVRLGIVCVALFYFKNYYTE